MSHPTSHHDRPSPSLPFYGHGSIDILTDRLEAADDAISGHRIGFSYTDVPPRALRTKCSTPLARHDSDRDIGRRRRGMFADRFVNDRLDCFATTAAVTLATVRGVFRSRLFSFTDDW